MVIAIMKMTFQNHSTVESYYRDYKHFYQAKFKNDQNKNSNAGITNQESFETTFILLKKTFPIKKNISKK